MNGLNVYNHNLDIRTAETYVIIFSIVCLCPGTQGELKEDVLYTNQFTLKLYEVEADILTSLRKYNLSLVYSLSDGYVRVRDESLPPVTSKKSVGMQRFIQDFKPLVQSIERVHYIPLTLHSQNEEKERLDYRQIVQFYPSGYDHMYYEKTKVCAPYYGMGVEKAWDAGYTGKGVTVGVVDIGVETTHVDLSRNIDLDTSFNFVEHNMNVKPQTLRNYPEMATKTNHGNEMAGLIAAEKGNGICSAGIAYNAKIAALRVFKFDDIHGRTQSDLSYIPKALNHKHDHIDIYSNSYNNINRFSVLSSDVKKILRSASTKGRHGKGSIIVFPSGDDGHANEEGGVNDCNTDPFANSIYTMTFSSVAPNGTRPDYAIPCVSTVASTLGWSNLIKSSSLTTANHRSMCTTVKGVSASTAMAAGIIALALEANPNLTQRDLLHLIVRTSSFSEISDPEPPTVNGAGHKYHPYYGFGLMNAYSLTREARIWKPIGVQKTMVLKLQNKLRLVRLCNTSKQVYLAQIVSPKCVPTQNCVRTLEHVMVNIDYSTANESQMNFHFCSPLGTCSRILSSSPALGSSRRVERQWNFTSMQFWREYPLGNWNLYIVPNESPNNHDFKILSMKIILFGTDNRVASISNEAPNKTNGFGCFHDVDVTGDAMMTSPSYWIIFTVLLVHYYYFFLI